MVASVTAAVTNIVLNYVCIRRFGFVAAGYTTMASNRLLTTMHYFNMRHIEKEKIYDMKKIMIGVVLVTAGCLACNLLYGLSSIYRYVLIVIALAVLLSQGKRVVAAINRMKI